MLTGLTYDIDISTHTPHARRDNVRNASITNANKFQLTRLMRGVTSAVIKAMEYRGFQLTRLMRGVTT